MIIIGGGTSAKILIITPILTLITSSVILYQLNGSTELYELVPKFINWWIIAILLFTLNSFPE